jgi:hypothetical protein
MARRAKALQATGADATPTRIDGALLRGPALDAWRAELSAAVAPGQAAETGAVPVAQDDAHT